MYITVAIPKELQGVPEEVIGKDIDLWISIHMPKVGPRHIVVSPMDDEYIVNVFRYRVKYNPLPYPKTPLLAQFTVKTVISP